ncbi:putative fatty acyl-CoA reductase CG8303 [Phlebotomus argentipes]|uniref:putative fatty acyl-CoA reductase CG8303 n=1 Tax=Phlebotomus argentipes TaxID=94469 RepID=UPI0028934A0A|nr:putative fatty acyl-CoA reductase CG8303 [Phlebotomus argentipes]
MGTSKSGHCGFIRLFVKGSARCVFGKPKSIIFAVPCDHVVNSTLALTVAVATRSSPSKAPEIIHATNNPKVCPLTVQEMADILNEEVWKNPCDSYPFLPRCKVRNGLRADLYFLVSYVIALLFHFPERIFNLSPPWMRGTHLVELQNKGRKYFTEISNCISDVNIEKYVELTNRLHPEDFDRWSFNPAHVDFRRLFASSISWTRQYYYKDSNSVTWMHRVVQRCFLMLEFFSYVTVFVITVILLFLLTNSWLIGPVVGILLRGQEEENLQLYLWGKRRKLMWTREKIRAAKSRTQTLSLLMCGDVRSSGHWPGNLITLIRSDKKGLAGDYGGYEAKT